MAEQPNSTVQLDPTKKEDMIDIQYEALSPMNERRKFLKQLNEMQTEFVKKEMPFDYRAAKMDFEAAQKELYDPNPRKYKYVESNVPVPNFDIKQYGDPKRFKLIKEEEAKEPKLIDGMKVMVTTGIYKMYQSKKCKNNIAVFTTIKKA